MLPFSQRIYFPSHKNIFPFFLLLLACYDFFWCSSSPYIFLFKQIFWVYETESHPHSGFFSHVFISVVATIFYCIWCHPVWTTWTVEGVIRLKLQIIHTVQSLRMVATCILYREGTWTFQTYQQLHGFAVDIACINIYITFVFGVCVCNVRLCKWLGYCKISKALISVYTINRKMGLKVCWG